MLTHEHVVVKNDDKSMLWKMLTQARVDEWMLSQGVASHSLLSVDVVATRIKTFDREIIPLSLDFTFLTIDRKPLNSVNFRVAKSLP